MRYTHRLLPAYEYTNEYMYIYGVQRSAAVRYCMVLKYALFYC